MLELLAQVHDEAAEALPDRQVDVMDLTGRDSLLLYSTLIELAGAIVALHRTDKLTGVAAIARSALDAFIDIKNLLRDPDYWKQLEAPDNAEWRKVLETASAGKNPFRDGIANDSELPKAHKMYKELGKQLAADDARRLSAEERFKLAGAEAEYRSLYPFRSSESHNNLSALVTRHLVQDESGKWVLDLYSGRAGFGHAVLLFVAEMLMHTSNDMHDRFGSGRKRVASIDDAVNKGCSEVQSAKS